MTDKIYANLLDIPIVGPGSQPAEEGDNNFDFIGSPGEMPVFKPPVLPEPEEVQDLREGMAMLTQLLASLEGYRAGEPAVVVDISHLDPDNIDLINQVLNEGEVSVVYEGDTRVQIQESVLTGIWRVRTTAPDGEVLSDVIEIADIPSIVTQKAFAEASALDTDMSALPPGVLNAPSLLIEIDEKMRAWQPGDPPHVINLTLLPLSPEDLTFLGARLGVGPVTVLSRGYGNCRVGSTARPNVWWVKFYNSEDSLILNTIEIIDVPEVAKAAPEDLADSAQRLREILQVYGLEAPDAE